MRLMGIGKLHALVFHGDRALAGAANALLAELRAASWSDADDALKAFPAADFHHHKIIIYLPVDSCAVLAVNYAAGVILIEFAGPSLGSTPQPTKTLRKKA